MNGFDRVFSALRLCSRSRSREEILVYPAGTSMKQRAHTGRAKFAAMTKGNYDLPFLLKIILRRVLNRFVMDGK